MSMLTKPYFHDEEGAFAHVEALLWKGRKAAQSRFAEAE